MRRLKTFVGLAALCAALGTTAGTTASVAVHAPNVRLRAGTSTNWSGYAESGAQGTFRNVSATWTQPAVTCAPKQTAYSAYWVGLDGDTTSTVEQLGTEADCVGGVPHYSSWYEMYPHRSYAASIPVVPNHTYQASVVSLGSGNFRLTLQDTTAAGTPAFTTVQKLNNAKLASAEAIVEAPSGGGVLPLANFGTANFSGVTVNNATMTGADEITMVNTSGQVKAQPSPLSGGSFSVTWKSAT